MMKLYKKQYAWVVLCMALSIHTDINSMLFQPHRKAAQKKLFTGVSTGDVRLIKEALWEGADINEEDKYGNSALTLARNRNDTKMVRTLELFLECGEPEEIEPCIQEKFFKALVREDVDLIQETVDAGADPDALNENGYAAISSVIMMHNGREVIDALIKAGANPNPKDRADKTPLMRAAEVPARIDVVKALIEAGADLKARYRDGETPLMVAAKNNNTAAIEALIRAGADINAKNRSGTSVLMFAVGHRDFLWSSRKSRADIVGLLIKAGADVKPQNYYESNALMWAAERGDTDSVNLLINAGSNSNARDRDGRTALMLAVAVGDTQSVAELLIHGKADPNIKNYAGKTALDIAEAEAAKNSGYDRTIIDYLKQAMALKRSGYDFGKK